MKGTAKITSLLLASLFATLIITRSTIQPVYGYTASASFCPNYYYDSEYDPPGEHQLAETLTEYIAYFFAERYDYSYLLTNESATVYYYRIMINSLNNSGEAGFFSKGHRNRWPHPTYDHIALFDRNGNDVRDSQDIFPYSSGKFRFVFLWHCETAELYPSSDDEGMPYCFTHNNNMVLYGQDYGYNVFLGWEDASPPVVESYPEQEPYGNWQYAHWAYLFFEAMSWGWSVEGALDYACNILSNLSFSCSHLYYWLIVWGCEDIGWPY